MGGKRRNNVNARIDRILLFANFLPRGAPAGGNRVRRGHSHPHARIPLQKGRGALPTGRRPPEHDGRFRQLLHCSGCLCCFLCSLSTLHILWWPFQRLTKETSHVMCNNVGAMARATTELVFGFLCRNVCHSQSLALS